MEINYLYLLLLTLICINIYLFFSFLIKKYKLKKEKLKTFEEKIDKLKKDNKLKIENLEKEIKEKERLYNENLEQKQKLIDKDLETYRIEKLGNIELEKFMLEEELNLKRLQLDDELEIEKIKKENIIKEENRKLLESLKEKFLEEEKQVNEQSLEIISARDTLLEELNEYKKKRDMVNEAIRREKEIEEKEDFYKLNLSIYDIQDIETLKEIEPKLKKKEALNKLIYDVFIKRPVLEMTKRVLNNSSFSGIYKITYIPTGESYIGKSTSIKTRWENHCKAVFGLGTLSNSSLHRKMQKDGIWNFSFEVIEEIEKEKLTEREKYWIDFYNTKNYGLNMREG